MVFSLYNNEGRKKSFSEVLKIKKLVRFMDFKRRIQSAKREGTDGSGTDRNLLTLYKHSIITGAWDAICVARGLSTAQHSTYARSIMQSLIIPSNVSIPSTIFV